MRNRLAVTQKSQATLKQPVKKPDLREYEIRHDNVVIGKKIGKVCTLLWMNGLVHGVILGRGGGGTKVVQSFV